MATRYSVLPVRVGEKSRTEDKDKRKGKGKEGKK